MNNNNIGIFLHHVIQYEDSEPEFQIDGNIYYFLDKNIAYTHKGELFQILLVSLDYIQKLPPFYARYFVRHDINDKNWFIVTPLTQNRYEKLPIHIKKIIHEKDLHSINIDKLKYHMYINCTKEGKEHHKNNIKYMSFMNNFTHKKLLEVEKSLDLL